MNPKTGKDISEWDGSYSLGIPEIDSQHQKLFELTALLYNSILDGVDRDSLAELLAELREYAEYHFKAEETLFSDHPEAPFHQQIHQAFILKINQFEEGFQSWEENLAENIHHFLRQWLITHILETDKRFLQTSTGASTLF